MKQSRLQVRPIYVYSADHVRADVFLCMLDYYLEWHLRKRPAPMLFEDHHPEGATARRKTKRPKSPSGQSRQPQPRSPKPACPPTACAPCSRILACNEATRPGQPNHAFTIIAQPTPLSAEAFQRLGVEPSKVIPVPLHP